MISRFWLIWIPLILLGIQAVFEVSYTSKELASLMSENGPVELLQWVIIVLALGVAAATLIRIDPRRFPWIFAWVLIATLACFYVAGEEVSWGQHFLNWNTPAYWQAINDQHETNLHNVSSWLDQKPRLILLIGIITGGLLFPLLNRCRPGMLPERFALIYPPGNLFLVAALVVGPSLANAFARLFGIHLFERVSEVQEVYMFYFVLFYLIILRRRILAGQA
jgi:glucan phosphoethanolaminetransferase (alkaline phosphatase superfamily)